LFISILTPRNIFLYVILYLNEKVLLILWEDKMIIEMSFGFVGGVNLGLERSWGIVENLLKKYPHATWRRIVDMKKGIGKYVVRIE